MSTTFEFNPGKVVDVTCPHCNHVNHINYALHNRYFQKGLVITTTHSPENMIIMNCDSEDGGCAKLFGVTIAAILCVKLYKIEGEDDRDDL